MRKGLYGFDILLTPAEAEKALLRVLASGPSPLAEQCLADVIAEQGGDEVNLIKKNPDGSEKIIEPSPKFKLV
ncbi:MAG TPA: hypothetical protein VJJ20_04000 [Candidatus Paceibacterota bacterium]